MLGREPGPSMLKELNEIIQKASPSIPLSLAEPICVPLPPSTVRCQTVGLIGSHHVYMASLRPVSVLGGQFPTDGPRKARKGKTLGFPS